MNIDTTRWVSISEGSHKPSDAPETRPDQWTNDRLLVAPAPDGDGVAVREPLGEILRFNREGGLTFLWALEANRKESDINPFVMEAPTIDGAVSLRFD